MTIGKKTTTKAKKSTTKPLRARIKAGMALTKRKKSESKASSAKTTRKPRAHGHSARTADSSLRAATRSNPRSSFAVLPEIALGSHRRPLLQVADLRRQMYYGAATVGILIGFLFFMSHGVQDGMDQKMGMREASIIAPRDSGFAQNMDHLVPRENTVAQTQAEVAPAIVETPSRLSASFKEMAGKDLAARMVYWSQFIEKGAENRESLKVIAEGRRIEDSAPIIPEKFNCTTFVETVASLARSSSVDEVYGNLMAVRYHESKPTFFSRNHFPELDWIPNNESAQILSDITSKIANSHGMTPQVEVKVIDRFSWLQAQIAQKEVSRGIASSVDSKWSKPASASVSYIPVEEIPKVLSEIPTGAIVNLVHKSDDAHPVLISHQGIIVRSGERVMIRHASRNGKIRTNELMDYLHSLKGRKDGETWPVVGINVNQISYSGGDDARHRASI